MSLHKIVPAKEFARLKTKNPSFGSATAAVSEIIRVRTP